jgi:putative nucleotidyltransferase with HDIG domain
MPPRQPAEFASLPPFPAVARKLLALLGSGNYTVPQVAALVKADAAFAVEVLRLANSALVGLRYEVVSIVHAISVLGTDRLRSLVLTVALRDLIASAKGQALVRACWRHNLAAALVAEAMADGCSLDSNDAYTAALLHDIGRLALVATFPARYPVDWAEDGVEAMARETAVLGINHAEAGAIVAEQWQLPVELRRNLATQLVVPAPDAFTMAHLVSVACGVAGMLTPLLNGKRRDWSDSWIRERLPEKAWAAAEQCLDELRQAVPVQLDMLEAEFLN